MTDNDKQLLLRIVWDRLNCGKMGGKQRHVEQAIFDAHNGRPDGFLVTTDNMWLFRQYRNSVSPSPRHLIDAALAHGRRREADAAYVDACEAEQDARINGGAR